MEHPGPRVFRFDPFELDEAAWTLSRSGAAVEIMRKPLEVLRYLIVHRERFVSREELFEQLWPGVRVSPGSLATAIYAGPSTIRTAPGAGSALCAVSATASSARYGASQVGGQHRATTSSVARASTRTSRRCSAQPRAVNSAS